MLNRDQTRLMKSVAAAGILAGASAAPLSASVLATENFFLPSAPGNALAAPYLDMVVNTTPITTWGEKGATGLQGSQSISQLSGGTVNLPASTVQFKFNIGAIADTLNTAYGAGHWTIANPTLTFQYTLYANNNIFGGGSGTFETYWVAKDNWAFGNGGSSGNAYSDSNFVAGTDPTYATTATSLLAWSGSEADLGSTSFNWLTPANNPNYVGWTTAKTGANQGMLTDNLAADPSFVSDITSATAVSNPNVSLYLIPSDTLGLTIFTGGGNVTPELSFQVVSVPEPTTVIVGGMIGLALLVRRKR